MPATPLLIFLLGFAAGFLARSFFWMGIVIAAIAAIGWLYLGGGGMASIGQTIKRMIKR